MTEDQTNAIRIALEVLQRYGLIPNKPIMPGTEAQALLTGAQKIAEAEVLAEVGHVILPMEYQEQLENILKTRFLGQPNTRQNRGAAQILAHQFLSDLKQRDVLPPGRFFKFRLDEYEINITGPF